MENFFSRTPRFNDQKIVTVGDAMSKLTAFNAQLEMSENGSVSACTDPAVKAQWSKVIRDGVIHAGGDAPEFNFFQDTFHSSTMDVEGTEVHVQYTGDRNYNIYPQAAANGAGPGQPVTFQMLRSMHSSNGKLSNIAVGGSIYNYADHQWLRVTAVDTTVDFAHQVTAIPFAAKYTAVIRANKPLLFSRIRIVDGYSCPVASDVWESPAYGMVVRPVRCQVDWESPLELDAPYKDKLNYALMWDRQTGKEIDSFEFLATTRAREDFMFDKNQKFFLGQKIDNPLLIGAGKMLGTDKYSGFDGYFNTLMYGGGMVQHTDPSIGYDLDSDFNRLILKQDAAKLTKEFFGLVGLRFRMSMERRSAKYFRDNAGQCTFETFKRTGMSQEDIIKHGIQSYSFMGYSMHLKTMSAMTDGRTIGNGIFPDAAMFMPGTGMRDDKGRQVSPIEIYRPSGRTYNGTYEEIFRDHRKIDGCNKVAGSISETFMMAVHGSKNHMLVYPKRRC